MLIPAQRQRELWEKSSGLMRYSRFDCGNKDALGAYCVAYRFIDIHDEWGHRFHGAKGLDVAHVCGAKALIALAARCVVTDLEWDQCCVLAAHPHDAAVLQSHHLTYKLGEAAANAIESRFFPGALKMKTHEALHSNSYSGYQRDSLVRMSYSLSHTLPSNNVIVVDDFMTRGSTINDIARAVLQHHPDARVYGLALGKSERSSFLARNGFAASNEHVPVDFANSWDWAVID